MAAKSSRSCCSFNDECIFPSEGQPGFIVPSHWSGPAAHIFISLLKPMSSTANLKDQLEANMGPVYNSYTNKRCPIIYEYK